MKRSSQHAPQAGVGGRSPPGGGEDESGIDVDPGTNPLDEAGIDVDAGEDELQYLNRYT